jgi:UDP-N-acetylmuramoyl-L-alanyl-D-glutamate--2,6-diaminopimelate ligase
MSHDHLDYHKTYDNYIKAKKKFFDDIDKEATVIVNIDDKQGRIMIQNCKSKIKTYGLKTMADYKAKILENNAYGLHLNINGKEAFFKMSGEFNAYNILAIYALASEFQIESELLTTVLSELNGAEGRFEKFISPKTKVLGIVDYAHTPDALENVLQTICDVKDTGSQIITVVGCGGDRDKTKRPSMAKIAMKMSDKAIFTSDNPRSEDPEEILNDMFDGLTNDEQLNVLRIEDRQTAIKTAVMLAQPGDVILVAGKGHEKTQEIKGIKYPFDDKKVLAEMLLKI